MSHKRSHLAQLRSSIIPLQIEIGTWANKNVEEILCLVCNEGLVEDEQHFIFYCNYYNPKRCDFLHTWLKSISNFLDLSEYEKLNIFMLKENLQEFSKYMCNIWHKARENVCISIYHNNSLILWCHHCCILNLFK